MQQTRPYVLSIAGFDPSSGAGISADLKTFEQLKVYGLGICSGLTRQTEDEFYAVDWRKIEEVKKDLAIILNKYDLKAVKFGILPSLQWLFELCSYIKEKNKNILIVVDPVWKSSTGFVFADLSDVETLHKTLSLIDLITPNKNEMDELIKKDPSSLKRLAEKCAVLLKGGHDEENKGVDQLYFKNNIIRLEPTEKTSLSKHGSGCVLSAAITAYLARGEKMEESCREAKKYTEKFLVSNNSLLGYHA